MKIKVNKAAIANRLNALRRERMNTMNSMIRVQSTGTDCFNCCCESCCQEPCVCDPDLMNCVACFCDSDSWANASPGTGYIPKIAIYSGSFSGGPNDGDDHLGADDCSGPCGDCVQSDWEDADADIGGDGMLLIYDSLISGVYQDNYEVTDDQGYEHCIFVESEPIGTCLLNAFPVEGFDDWYASWATIGSNVIQLIIGTKSTCPKCSHGVYVNDNANSTETGNKPGWAILYFNAYNGAHYKCENWRPFAPQSDPNIFDFWFWGFYPGGPDPAWTLPDSFAVWVDTPQVECNNLPILDCDCGVIAITSWPDGDPELFNAIIPMFSTDGIWHEGGGTTPDGSYTVTYNYATSEGEFCYYGTTYGSFCLSAVGLVDSGGSTLSILAEDYETGGFQCGISCS